MIKEETRIHVVLKVDPEFQSALVDDDAVTRFVVLFVLGVLAFVDRGA